jgi:hypothetical protein
MVSIRIATSLAAAAAALAVPPAHAASSVTVNVAVTNKYGVCATVTRSSGQSVSATVETHGTGAAGTSSGVINDSKGGSDSTGSVTVCTVALPFNVVNGALTTLVTWSTPSTAAALGSKASAPSGGFVVYCASVQGPIKCSPTTLTINDLG